MAAQKKLSAGQIINQLRRAEVALANGKRVKQVCRELGVSEQTYCRWRGNVSLSNLEVLNAILYVAEHGCKWRGLPPRFGNWHTIYTRMNRWARAGVLDRVFAALQDQQIIRIKIEALSIDNTIVKVHPDGDLTP